MFGKKFFGYRSFGGVVPFFLPFFYNFLSFLTFYFTFWKSDVAYVNVSGGLLSTSVSKFISIVSCMRLNPGVFNVPENCKKKIKLDYQY